MPIESVMPSSHLILCGPLLLLPPIPPSIKVFSNEYYSTRCYIFVKFCKFLKSHGIFRRNIPININEHLSSLFSWAPKSLQMVTAAMKLKDAYSLEEKL